jgi:hypothetical protein
MLEEDSPERAGIAEVELGGEVSFQAEKAWKRFNLAIG